MLNVPPQLKLREEEQYGGDEDDCDSPQDRIPTCIQTAARCDANENFSSVRWGL